VHAVQPHRCLIRVPFCEYPRVSGEYAYCTVIKALDPVNPRYRVLALSATPGTDVHKVQEVINALHISHIEVCVSLAKAHARCPHRVERRPYVFVF
jgi:ATP-dependent DNA helicase MPH1